MHQSTTFNLLTILGPTASGKTSLAVALAKALGGEIISADSRQVFRGMDIGSGKDMHEYGNIPCHLIDILDAGEEFSVFAFQRCFLEAFNSISSWGRISILCGGTGMYLDAALRGYRLLEVPENAELRAELSNIDNDALVAILCDLRPGQHNTTDRTDRARTIRAIEISLFERLNADKREPWPDIRPLVFGIRWERSQLRQRITERLKNRLDSGMVKEVQRLHNSGIPWERLDYYGLEYRFAGSFLRGEISANDMFQKLNSAIHDFAKRQETWFRRMEKNGVMINWLEGNGDTLKQAMEILQTTLQDPRLFRY